MSASSGRDIRHLNPFAVESSIDEKGAKELNSFSVVDGGLVLQVNLYTEAIDLLLSKDINVFHATNTQSDIPSERTAVSEEKDPCTTKASCLNRTMLVSTRFLLIVLVAKNLLAPFG